MRKLTVGTFVSLDGVMQAPGGPDEDSSGGFAHGGWLVPYFDEALGQHMDEWMSPPFDLLLGRRTYEIFAAHWPHADDPTATLLNQARKYVVSTTLDAPGWNNSVVVRGDIVAEIARLKALEGPELQVHGSSVLVQALLAGGLVDELHLRIAPVILGHGKRLFAEGAAPQGLALLGSKTTPAGVILATFRRDGAVRSGSFALPEPSAEELERRGRITEEG